MTVRRTMLIAVALVAALLGAGCGDRGGSQLMAETDDPYYVQGVQLKRQGRNPEALTSFLKVIDRRGERGAPEAHLEVGQIYLDHFKEPAYAYYHFRRYLELQPNSPQSDLVRGRVAAALREFAKTVPGRTLEDQSVRMRADAEISKLQQEVEELRAELAVLRGSATMPVNRPARMITVPNAGPTSMVNPPVTAAPPANAPIVAAPRPALPAAAGPGAPQQAVAATPARAAPIQPAASARPPAPARTTTPAPARTTAPAPTGKTHTVVAKDTLFSLSKRYGVRMEDLAAANGLPSVSSPLKIGTVLKIPAAAPTGR